MFEVPFTLVPFEKTDEFSINGKVQIRDRILICDVTIDGKIHALKLPSHKSSKKKEGLWNSTCFELFIKSGTQYIEWNFAPSGDWWVMDFSNPRMRLGSVEVQKIYPIKTLWMRGDSLSCEIEIPLVYTQAIEIGVSCILETDEGKTHWALTHLSEKPDFHHPGSFKLLST